MPKINKASLLELLLIIILQPGLLTLKGQEKEHTQTKYLNDFDYFIEKLIETHPDPYTAFGNQIEFHRAKQMLNAKVAKVTSDEEFISLLNGFISNLEDGHTFISLPASLKSKVSKKLPFELKVTSDYLMVQNTIKGYEKYIGKAVVEINKQPISDLLLKVKRLKTSENISGTYYNLKNLIKKESTAKMLFKESGKTEFKFRDEKTDVLIPFVEEANFPRRKSKFEIKNSNGLLNWQLIGTKSNIGYLVWNGIISREVPEAIYAKSPSYVESNLAWPYSFLNIKRTGNIEKDIQQVPSLYEQLYLLLKEMKEKLSESLIIDLRKNGGGMTPLIYPVLYMLHGDYFLNFDFNAEYIKKYSPLFAQRNGYKSIEQFEKVKGVKNGDYEFEMFGNVSPGYSLEEKRAEIEQGYHESGSEFVKKTIQLEYMPANIIVLTSPTTFSAAYHFTYFLKRLGKSKILGVPSRQAGNSFMEVTTFVLPETKLSGSISNAKQILFKDNPELGKLLKPDIEMKWADYQKYGFDENAEVLRAIDFIELN